MAKKAAKQPAHKRAKKAAKKTTTRTTPKTSSAPRKTTLQNAEEQITKGVERSAEWIEKNPGKVLAAAAALGALASTLFRRKKKK